MLMSAAARLPGGWTINTTCPAFHTWRNCPARRRFFDFETGVTVLRFATPLLLCFQP
jgi:hypothetical protein